MASEGDSSALSQKIAKLNINENISNNNEGSIDTDNLEYGLPLAEVYKLGFNFYREKEGKAFHFSYEDKLQLVAFSQQVLHGPLTDVIQKLPPLGTLDVVGKDRRLAWQKLGKLSANQARTGFVELLSRRCPLFSTYVEAHRREKKEQERKRKEQEEKMILQQREEHRKKEEEKLVQEQLNKDEAIKRQIQQALNEQTFIQFREYAEQQFPGDPEKQGGLIRQLQEQHYIQYMQQLQAAQNNDQLENKSSNEEERDVSKDEWDDSNDERESNKTLSKDLLQQCIVPASMWTRSDVQQFKQVVSQSEGNGVVRVGHGETVTVRVPTHPNGSRIFWEFATDYYDIGFGVYFEFGVPTTDQVSVHVTESDEEDPDELDDEVEDDDETIRTGDLEAGSLTVNGVSRPLLTQVVPVYRRDCQLEVYAGSHEYPGQGIYLLKFDNSYSLWRSKTLYYRVYYTQ